MIHDSLYLVSFFLISLDFFGGMWYNGENKPNVKENTMHLDLDIEQFWKDDALAHEENCFSKRAPQAALGIRMSDECVFAELGEEGQPWGYTDPVRRYDLNCRYNEKARKIVGRPLLRENPPLPPESARFTRLIVAVEAPVSLTISV